MLISEANNLKVLIELETHQILRDPRFFHVGRSAVAFDTVVKNNCTDIVSSLATSFPFRMF